MTANFTGGAGGGAYTYAGDSQPADPVEGETWYDTGANEAYVFDGASWVKQTVVDHRELSGISAGQHRSDQNIRSTVDGANVDIEGDANTLDGNDASAFASSLSVTDFGDVSGQRQKGTWYQNNYSNGILWVYPSWNNSGDYDIYPHVNDEQTDRRLARNKEGGEPNSTPILVPPGYYYKFEGDGTLQAWFEFVFEF